MQTCPPVSSSAPPCSPPAAFPVSLSCGIWNGVGAWTHTHTRLSLILTVMGPVEAAPEYRVIVDANNLTVEIENELSECQEGQAETALPRVPHSLLPSPREGQAGSQAVFPAGLSRGPAPKPLYQLESRFSCCNKWLREKEA